MTDKGIKVTCEDLETGETQSRTIWNDYMVITAGDRYISHVNAHQNGNNVVTIKQEKK